MGISKVIGIAGTSLLVTSVGLWKIGLRIVAVPFLATSTIAYIIAVASHNSINIPWMLGKNSKGRFPIWSSVLFGPFLILARVYATVKRHMRKKEAVYNMITEGVYLGGWPFMLKHLPPGDPSVIDCTCELPRSDFVPTNEYLCVPTWDTRAPMISQIEFAACWACEKRAKGKLVYVHCAFGHGRSACVVCAVLVALGIAENWKDAENIIREKRKIKMNAVHRKTLDDWSKYRASQKKDK
uniref:protein-tyrosine-phosphatase n=1 Tax=Oryza glumipatula TaxID=40148 RepID=A0A0E0BSZ7_9ORYZ